MIRRRRITIELETAQGHIGHEPDEWSHWNARVMKVRDNSFRMGERNTGRPHNNCVNTDLENVLKDEGLLEAIMKAVKTCDGCGGEMDDRPALSRRDNKTLVCSDCGTREALEDMKIGDNTLHCDKCKAVFKPTDATKEACQENGRRFDLHGKYCTKKEVKE